MNIFDKLLSLNGLQYLFNQLEPVVAKELAHFKTN